MIKNIGWSIGNYCNAQCKHCYSWKTRRTSKDVLTKDEIDTIIDKLIAAKIETVNFGGNEPIFTQGPDLEKTMLPYIITRFNDAGIICGITTNGFTAHYLHEHHHDVFMMVNDWDFSMDSPFEDEHNSNRSVCDSYELILSGLKLCSEYNRPKSIVIAGMKWNMEERYLDSFLELAVTYDTELRINTLKPIEPHHFDLLPETSKVYDAFKYLFENTNLITLGESVFAAQAGLPASGCACGLHSLRIQSKKNNRVPVTPCVYLSMDGGDILTQELDEIVNSETFKKFNERREYIPSKCREINCDILESCRGGCYARTVLMYEDTNYPDPYCPYAAKEKGIGLCSIPKVVKEDDSKGIRVHENYLCTWIGEPKNKAAQQK